MKDFLDELDAEVQAIIPDAGAANIPKPTVPQNPPKKHNSQAVMHKPVPKEQYKKEITQSVVSTPQVKQTTAPQEAKKPQHNHNNASQKRKTKPTTGHASQRDDMDGAKSKYGRKIIQFPETKFFLPTLREGYTRYIPIG